MVNNSVLLNSFRDRLAMSLAGQVEFKPIGFMAFGTGGHDEQTGELFYPSPEQTTLINEVLRKSVTHQNLSQPNPLSIIVQCRIEREECVGLELSESALFDTDGNCIAIRNFRPKYKEDDEFFDIAIEINIGELADLDKLPDIVDTPLEQTVINERVLIASEAAQRAVTAADKAEKARDEIRQIVNPNTLNGE